MAHSDVIDPQQRYLLDGCFSPDSFDEDRAAFPEFFDENGWPLFGTYDRHALRHPITGTPWYEAPRVPDYNDSGSEYEDWHFLAVEFDNLPHPLFQKISALPRTLNYPDALTSYAIYPRGSESVQSNAAYLEKHLIPKLDKHFADRTSTPAFAVAWGEFRQIAESLDVSIKLSHDRRARAATGGGANKDAQLKWYLHWRRYCMDMKGWSATRTKQELCVLVREITQGRVKPPTGFTPDWFNALVGKVETIGSDGTKALKVVTDLPDSFKRPNSHPRMKLLLEQQSTDGPPIPPVDPAAYSIID